MPWSKTQNIRGPAGPQGAPGPTTPSTDAGNLTRAGSDGLLYTPADWLLTADVTLHVATTGSDTTGDGSQAAPWATPHRAMAFLRGLLLADGVFVTISIADGAYTFSKELNLNHPQGTQISIEGTSTSGTRPTGTSLNGGGGKGYSTTTESFNDAKLKAFYRTQWQFNGCDGLRCDLGGGVTVDKLLIRGNGTTYTDGVLAGGKDPLRIQQSLYIDKASTGSINLGQTVGVHNFGGVGIATGYGGSICAEAVTVTNTKSDGIRTYFGGSSQAYQATISNCNGDGIATCHGGSINAMDAMASNNLKNGIICFYGGSILAKGATAANNLQSGVMIRHGGTIYASAANASRNGQNGFATSYGGSIYGGDLTAASNQKNGIYIGYGGNILASAATLTGNGESAAKAEGDGFLRLNGAIYDGILSPPANTLGNGKAYIQTI